MKRLMMSLVCGVLVLWLTTPGCGEESESGDTDNGADADTDSDTDTDTDSDTDTDADTDSDDIPAETTYCDTPMFELPQDPAAQGPWAVGARTIDIDYLHAEVWYPAKHGSADGQEMQVYDLREYLPQQQQDNVEDTDSILQPCECYQDLPIDDEHGPYPVIVFAHGMSGFKGQSLEFMTHWASRGFVVLSSDAPSIGLKTFLEIFSGNALGAVQDLLALISGMSAPSDPGGNCDPTDAKGQTGDLVFMLDALKAPSGDLAFLEGHIDLSRIGASGHSAGGGAVLPMGGYPGVKVVIPQAMNGTCDGEYLESTVVIGGMADSIVAFSGQRSGYNSSPPPKRLIGLTKAGHMAMTSFCPIGEDDGGIIEAAKKAGVKFNPLFETFITPLASDGCGPKAMPAELGWEIINYATSAAFEEVLLCTPKRGEQLSGIAHVYPEVGTFEEEL